MRRWFSVLVMASFILSSIARCRW